MTRAGYSPRLRAHEHPVDNPWPVTTFASTPHEMMDSESRKVITHSKASGLVLQKCLNLTLRTYVEQGLFADVD